MSYFGWTNTKRRMRRQNSERPNTSLSRRLRAELLEGRMMLSATSPEFIPTSLPLHIGTLVGEPSSALIQFKSSGTIIEGGFIHDASPPMGQSIPANTLNANRDSDQTISQLITQGSFILTDATG